MILLIVILIMGSTRQLLMETGVPGKKELLAVGLEAGMKKDNCIKIIDSIQTCVKEMLGNHWGQD